MEGTAPDSSNRVDSDGCDREPVHVPGAIQPHGVLLVLHPQQMTVLQVAGDTPAMFGQTAAALLGKNLAELLSPEAVDDIRRALLDGPLLTPLHMFAVRPLGSTRDLDAVIHDSQGAAVLELEPARRLEVAPGMSLAMVESMLARLRPATSLLEFCQVAVEQVQLATGFDRVMVYRFLPDDSGEVIAEARRADLDPYLGLHYPASDIPAPARALFRCNWLRLIPDIDVPSLPLLPAAHPLTGRPLDMSRCVLRAVSPIHIEYLSNMGVRATMSLSILHSERLWGLIACHHLQPKPVAADVRVACQLFAQMFSMQVEAKERSENDQHLLRSRMVHGQLVTAMARSRDVADALIRQHPTLRDYIPADGVALWLDGKLAACGATPDADWVQDLVGWLDRSGGDGVFSTAALPALYPPAAARAHVASGLLAMSLSRTAHDYVLWFRGEAVRVVTWAGDPRKPVAPGPDETRRLSPRTSFAAWQELVRGRSRPWTPSEIDAARELRVSLIEVVLSRIEQVAEERRKAKERLDVLLAELSHRVRNTLAKIQAVMRYSQATAPTAEAFAAAFERRILAMARAHTLLTEMQWQRVPLHSLILDELCQYRDEDDSSIIVDGPPIAVGPRVALALSTAFHELATNSAKYGALSVPQGRVQVHWEVLDGKVRELRLQWRETRGPRVEPITRRGFGTTVLEQLLPHEVGGTTELAFAAEGLVFTFAVELAQLVAEDTDAGERAFAGLF